MTSRVNANVLKPLFLTLKPQKSFKLIQEDKKQLWDFECLNLAIGKVEKDACWQTMHVGLINA